MINFDGYGSVARRRLGRIATLFEHTPVLKVASTGG
jgi:hypothetical protein